MSSNLTKHDRTSVPLPNGAEVTTRIERKFDDRSVPQGAIGRVVRSDGDRVEVRLVGIGQRTYLRSEILPRNTGQFRFAVKRERAWQALKPTVVLDTVVGSRAWGLADEDSDIDRRGVFVLPFSWTLGMVEPPGELISTCGSETYWEVEKALRQALRADPNTLEMLFLEEFETRDEIGQWLIEERDAFASKQIYSSFGRYALSQLKRLEKSMRLAEHRGQLVEWLRLDPGLSLTELAQRLVRECEIEAPTERQSEQLARQYIKQLYRSMFDQGLLERRDLSALADYARTSDPDFELPRELSPKNAYNLLRLIDLATGWLRKGRPRFEVASPLREELLEIKRGAVPFEEVTGRAEEMAADLESARRSSSLPEAADLERADRLLRRVREEVARRHFDGLEGIFGRGAPEAPLANWSADSQQEETEP